MKKLILSILFPVLIFAQEEILINDFAQYNQRSPVISGPDDQGNSVVVWVSENQVDSTSKKDIVFKIFTDDLNSSSNEQLVNDITEGEQEFPAAAVNSSGKMIVAWASYDPRNPDNLYDIKTKLYENGVAVTEEFFVNTFKVNSQTVPSTDINNNGEFVIVWESWDQDGSGRGIYAQLFDENGNKTGEEFRVNSTIDYSQTKPKVKYLNNGNFVVVWESWNEIRKDYDLYAKLFDSNADIIIEEKKINSYSDDYQWFADLDINSKNEIAIVWCSWEQDGYDGGVYLNKFDSLFNPILSEQLVNNSKRFYQWLPKVKFLNDEDLVILWSGWKTDGSREGVYYRLVRIPEANNQYKFLNQETRINDFTEGYQWEPDFIIKDNKVSAVWSSWNQFGEMYDVVGKSLEPDYEYGVLESDEVKQINGITSSEIDIHIVNNAEVTNHKYEVTFEGDEDIFMNVKDLDSDEIKVSQFPLNLGEDVYYATDEFDGIVLNIQPEFELGLNEEKTIYEFYSSTNIEFEVKESSINQHLVPLNVIFWFGSTDTLSNGNYASPTDTAYNTSLNKIIEVPFKANATVGLPYRDLEFIIMEKKVNNKWDPGEKILIRTPERYRENEYETFLEINSSSPENPIMPDPWDKIYIYMNKPLTSEDVFQFQVDSSKIILDVEEENIVDEYKLYQNYPNPFNPSTTIEYSIPRPSKVTLEVFDVLGQRVETLVNDFKGAGQYSFKWNPKNISSGIYFYILQSVDSNGKKVFFTKKMLYLK